MIKIKVHEVAKALDLKSADVVSVLKALGQAEDVQQFA